MYILFLLLINYLIRVFLFCVLIFVVANEICEKLAVVGFNANMISYLTNELHMPLTKAANTLTNLGGTASLTPLIGAFVADSFAGRFWTITAASIIYQIVNTPSLPPLTLPSLYQEIVHYYYYKEKELKIFHQNGLQKF